MIQNRIPYLLLSLTLLLSSCTPRRNKSYAADFLSLDKVAYAKKYLTLYSPKDVVFSAIKENKAYFQYQNGDAFRIVVFSNDHYMYCSVLMPLTLLQNIPKQKLYRSDYFTVEGEIVKIEAIDINIESIIEEGAVEKDTIFMKKKYMSKKANKEHPIKDKYILMPKVIVYNFNDFIVIETKQ